MKTLEIETVTLDGCVASAQSERIVITRNGAPIARIVGLQGMDAEQIELGASSDFWGMIRDRRQESMIDRTALEKTLRAKN